MNKLAGSAAVLTASLALFTLTAASSSNWPCETPNIMDCSDLPGGDPHGYTPCMMPDGTGGFTQIGDCADVSIYVCNGRNENCDLGQDCNVMVEYPAEGCRIYCVKNFPTSRRKLKEVGHFLGWCASTDLGPGRPMNLKCAVEDIPCTGMDPEEIGPTDPIYEPGPGENRVPFQGPVFVPVQP